MLRARIAEVQAEEQFTARSKRDHFAPAKGVEDICRYDRLTRVKKGQEHRRGFPGKNNLHQAAQQACLLKVKTCGEFWGNEDAKFRTASASVVCSHDAVIGGSECHRNVVVPSEP